MLKSHKSTIAFLCDYSSEDDQNNIEKTAKDLATFKTYTDNLQFKGHKKCHYIWNAYFNNWFWLLTYISCNILHCAAVVKLENKIKLNNFAMNIYNS